ncbi:hypothetical protein E2C06_08040 [Dankookia rubra]|uniref:TIGR02646 family protein n=1 Tax=Dankookia rubra TaxID=1442381 RepID=A0A4R5QKF8_9PROT|nr:hypothetical protein [Dankookia rubra]TDH63309.1 hypothetical protein E2C06_08040 [Dankookia rubra]
MIFIRFDEAIFPAEVRREAERLTTRLVSLTTDRERRAFITRHSAFWREMVKPHLELLSHNKCWYSEAKDKVSFWHVDHFRPKGRVANEHEDPRSGYWWLAFNLSNYRLAGAVMNTPSRDEIDGPLLGKWDKFPLAKGSFIATLPTEDIRLETCLLLDPCNDLDPALITFDEAGKPVPACPAGTVDFDRVELSIDVLHLDFEPLNEVRREIWNKCDELAREAAHISAMPIEQRVYAQAKLLDLMRQIREMVLPTAELSSVAKAYLLKCKLPWLQRLASPI